MENLLIYVSQVNLLLAIVYGGYALLLKNLTFYRLNRFYFISGVLFAFCYPFLDLRAIFLGQIEPMAEIVYLLPDVLIEQSQGNANKFSLLDLVFTLLSIGMLFFVVRLSVQLLSLLRIHLHSTPASWQRFWYRDVRFPIAPFSFFNTIYLHKVQHQEHELPDIFKHEDIHVKGYHTLDILFFELAFILCWYNPAVWLMRKALRQNLEFLTDQQVLDRGADRQVYQYSLLNVSKQGGYTAVTNQFNFNILKKRIMMMNKRRSSRLELSKYVFLLPVLVFVAGAFTVTKAERKIKDVVDKAEHLALDVMLPNKIVDRTAIPMGSSLDTNKNNLKIENVLIVVDGREMDSDFKLKSIPSEEIESIDVLKDDVATARYGEKGKAGVVLVTMKKVGFKIEGYRSDDPSKDGNLLNSGNWPKDVRERGDDLIKEQRQIVGATSKTDTLGHPIYVLEGKKIDRETLSRLDPNDIQSVDVFKDDSAVKLYGEEGKNGAIVIRLKKKVDGAELLEGVTIIGYGGKDSKVAPKIDVQPEPKGGMQVFRKWISDHYQYPQEAIDAGVKGTVIVSFIVEKDGALSEIKATQDIGHKTGEASVELLKRSPNWLPATVDGEPIRMQYSLPIRLDLSQ